MERPRESEARAFYAEATREGWTVADALEAAEARGLVPVGWSVNDGRAWHCAYCDDREPTVNDMRQYAAPGAFDGFDETTLAQALRYGVERVLTMTSRRGSEPPAYVLRQAAIAFAIKRALLTRPDFTSSGEPERWQRVLQSYAYGGIIASPCRRCNGANWSAQPATLHDLCSVLALGYDVPPREVECGCATWMRCTLCLGRGDLVDQPSYGAPMERRACPLCAGSGRIRAASDHECLRCGGQGAIAIQRGHDTAEHLAREVVGALRAYGHRGDPRKMRVVWRVVALDPMGDHDVTSPTLRALDQTCVWQCGGIRLWGDAAFGDGTMVGSGARLDAGRAIVEMGLRLGAITDDAVTLVAPRMEVG